MTFSLTNTVPGQLSSVLSLSQMTTVGKVNNKHAKPNMKNTTADNALSNKTGAVIKGLLGKREHVVIVTPLKQPVLWLIEQMY